ncbi:MAG: hypothetical protein WC831_02300 [Parcubacteria group bacterium]|jgi:hypothetical protein
MDITLTKEDIKMSEHQWPTLYEVYFAVWKALGEEGIRMVQYGEVEFPCSASRFNDCIPADIFIYLTRYYFKAELRVVKSDSESAWVREAVLRQISKDFKESYTVYARDFKSGLFCPVREMAWNLAGALEAFRTLWPKIKASEEKYSTKLEEIRQRALDECFG